MTWKRTIPAPLSVAFSVASLIAGTTAPSRAVAVHPESWPPIQRTVGRDARIERRVDAILKRMSLEEKAGQVIQGGITTVKPEDVRTYHLGSVLNGGGGWPGDVRKAKP